MISSVNSIGSSVSTIAPSVVAPTGTEQAAGDFGQILATVSGSESTPVASIDSVATTDQISASIAKWKALTESYMPSFAPSPVVSVNSSANKPSEGAVLTNAAKDSVTSDVTKESLGGGLLDNILNSAMQFATTKKDTAKVDSVVPTTEEVVTQKSTVVDSAVLPKDVSVSSNNSGSVSSATKAVESSTDTVAKTQEVSAISNKLSSAVTSSMSVYLARYSQLQALMEKVAAEQLTA
jgi:hypothetical protein